MQLLLIEIAFQFGAYMTNPVVSGYALLLGASVAMAGFLSSLTATTALAMRPFIGWITDRFSMKAMLAISAILFAFSSFGCAITDSIALIGVLRVLQGVAFALRSTSVVALVSMVVSQNYIGRAVGWTGIGQSVACALGPLFGAAIIAKHGYTASFVVASLLFVGGLALVLSFESPQKKRFSNANGFRALPRMLRACLRRLFASSAHMPSAHASANTCVSFADSRALHIHLQDFLYLPNLPLALISGLLIVPHGVSITLILVVGQSRGIGGVAAYFAVYSLVALVAKPLSGRMTDLWGAGAVLIPALLIEFCATIIMALMSDFLMVVLAAICMGLGQASAYSAVQAECVRGVDERHLGRATNTFYFGTDIGMGFGPMAASVVMQIFGSVAMYVSSGALVLAALLVFLCFRKSQSGKCGQV